MTDPVITADEVRLSFQPHIERSPTLRRTLGGGIRRAATVKALDGVSFTVRPGEALGIIGRNGAGKSTLLRVLAGTLLPDSGSVQVRGRSMVLQLGLGFKKPLSGTRNIYLGGLLAGLTRAQIDERVQDIVDYSGIGDAVMRPVDTYSSGMFARLAFAISVHLDADIVLLDEVLSVGDKDFREKSLATMTEHVAAGGTVVFVSHDLDSVAGFCDQVMWMERGRTVEIGPAAEVVEHYRGSPTA